MEEDTRYIVRISCQNCGEHYILKGRLRKGKIETGFQRCLCNNENDFEILNERL